MALLAVALAAACAASLALGSKAIPLGDVLDALVDFDGSPHDLVVRELRIPRTALALVVGAALGTAGAVMQGLTRNPLADPGILGVNAGASLGVVVAIFGFGIADLSVYAWFAVVGGALAGTVVYALGATGRSAATPARLALAGMAVTALVMSVTRALLLLDEAAFDQFRFWVVGSVAGRSLAITGQVLPFLVVGGAVAVAAARHLDALALGEDMARSLGSSVARPRVALAAAVVLLVGGAVAAAGPVAFVGLAVPHAARLVVGNAHRRLLPCSALVGALLVVGADVFGRIVARPGEAPVGIVTAAIGAPVFVALVRRRRVAAL